MSRLLARLRNEEGIAMIMAILIGLLLTAVTAAMITVVTSEASRSAQAVIRQQAFQAAEAGIDAYTSKLLEDGLYYTHQVAVGESTRRAQNGTLVAAGQTWPFNPVWTYPTDHNAWSPPFENGYEYNLQITAPDSTGAVGIVAIGRKHNDTNTKNWREVQVLIRPSSLAEYYRVVDGDVGFGSNTTTNGKVYANGDIDHDGTATANLYAEGDVTGSYDLENGATIYDEDTNPTIRSQIPVPIQFSSFLASLSEISTAAQDVAGGGRYLNDATRDAWVLTFQPNGTFTAKACDTDGDDLGEEIPNSNCTSTQTYSVPVNGAIYSPQSVMVSGTVVGRVTIGTNNNMYIKDDISYGTPGQDVLGLVALNSVIIGEYVPDDLVWRAAVIAQSGTWRTYAQDGSHDTMTFTGSSATADGGQMTMFDTRTYSYDSNLHQLPPPWFPVLEDSYTTLIFRELAAG
jgi:Tfp pilus assembly protein PilX